MKAIVGALIQETALGDCKTLRNIRQPSFQALLQTAQEGGRPGLNFIDTWVTAGGRGGHAPNLGTDIKPEISICRRRVSPCQTTEYLWHESLVLDGYNQTYVQYSSSILILVLQWIHNMYLEMAFFLNQFSPPAIFGSIARSLCWM